MASGLEWQSSPAHASPSRMAPQRQTMPGAPDLKPPATLHVLGRSTDRENGDICGEYTYVSNRCGFPAYLNRTNGIAIRFWAPLGRWVMDRGGIRDSDVCVAYATVDSQCSHPAHPELVWHVWESRARSHVADDQVMAIDGPENLEFVGRDVAHNNSMINGKYKLAGIVNGRPAYNHQNNELLMRYLKQENRWLISHAHQPTSTVCCAWADATDTKHPADPRLKWHIWDAEKNEFALDMMTGALTAPAFINVVGRHPHAFNASINGTYKLAGVHECRPIYVQPETQAVLRYSGKSDRWLIDNDGVSKPSLASRFYQWVMTGDSDAAYESCSAFATANGAPHPGLLCLQWKVWEQAGARFKLDHSIVATSAPMSIQISGRDVRRENSDVNGDFRFVGAHGGYPAYQQVGSDYSMYFSKHGKWIIDRHGMRDSGSCVACADPQDDSDHPPTKRVWQVFETMRGNFLPDPSLALHATYEQVAAHMPDSSSEPRRDIAGPPRGVKRGCGAEYDFVHDAYGPQAKSFRAEQLHRGGSSWFSLFGA